MTSRLAWLTPDDIPSEGLRRWLCIPNEPALLAAVTGALLPLSYEENWELYGTQTPTDVAAAMSVMLEDFLAQEGACLPMLHTPILISDRKAQNVDGGTFNNGAWRTRDLNTLVDLDNIGASLSSNQFTLPAGIWLIKWSAPARLVDGHQSRLFSVTENTAIDVGTTEYAPNADNQTRSFGMVIQTNVAATTYRIEHRCIVSRATDGFGFAANIGQEVYTQVEANLIS